MPGRTAILVVNGFDVAGRWGQFDPGDAVRYPWLELCLREVERRSHGSGYEVLVWDNTQAPELRAIARRHRVRLYPTDEQLKEAAAGGTEQLVFKHSGSLQRLLERIGPEFEYVMTLDTDAFPIRDRWIEDLQLMLSDASLAGVWRDEMVASIEPYVHPSCLFIRRQRLLEIGEAFSFTGVKDVGQRITKDVTGAGEVIVPLRRSNVRNAHFLMGGLYGDLVYHQAAGSRFPAFRMSEGEERELATYTRLREAAFTDLDHLVAVLRGQVDDDLGLEVSTPAPMIMMRPPGLTPPVDGESPASETGQGPGRTSEWLEDLPGEMQAHAAILRTLLDAAEADQRIRAVQVQGSIGRGSGDMLSDLDVGIVVSDAAWPDICREVPDMLRRGGRLVDEYYNFLPSPEAPELFKAWGSYADGIQLDVMLLPGRQVLGSGPDGRNLLDRDGRLARTDHPMRLAEPDEIVKWAFLAWQNMTEVAKYLERERAVAAAEWLNSARQATISCWAAAHGVEYAGYANVAAAQLGVSVPMPAGLERTYSTPVAGHVLEAAISLAEVQARADAMLEMRLGIPRRPLGDWVVAKLVHLREGRPPADSPEARSSDPERGRPAASRRPRPPVARRRR